MKVSSCAEFNAGVPQDSMLGSLLFLIYVDDLTGDLSSNGKLFADDTLLCPNFDIINTTTHDEIMT